MNPESTKEFVSFLPKNTKFQLARDAAREQNIQWMTALYTTETYDIPPVVNLDFNPGAKYSPFEWTMIASLGDIIHESNLKGFRIVAQPGYLEFFQKMVDQFMTELSARLQKYENEGEYIQKRHAEMAGNTTAGVLMAVACAINDAHTVTVIGTRFKMAMVMTLSPLLMLGHSINSSCLITPAACAIRFGSLQAMEALIALGLKATSPIAYDLDKKDDQYKKRGPHAVSAASKPISVFAWMAREIERIDLGKDYNHFFEQIIDKLYKTIDKDVQKSGILNLSVVVISKKRTETTDRNPIFATLNRLGVFDINVNGFASVACSFSNHLVIEMLRHRIDWTKWDGVDDATMKDFPPIALASSKYWDKSRDELELIIQNLCQACVKAGMGKLLARTGDSSSAKVFAEKELITPLVMALEEGADPNEKLGDGRTLLDHVLSNERSAQMVRSFLTKRAAMSAMNAIDSIPIKT